MEYANEKELVTQLMINEPNIPSAEVLATCKRIYPNSHMSISMVNWYRNQLRKQGIDIPLQKRRLNNDSPRTTK